jgi:lysophospholipase L1-like esterase
MSSMKAAVSLPVLCLALAFGTGAAAQTEPRLVPPAALAVAPSPEYQAAMARWQGSLAAFANADRESLPATDGVLFVGSSTIRFWKHLAQDFSQLPVVINRGFGGSTMADCSLFARDLVVRYKPRHVLVYAGDNDLAEGRTPMQVMESFARFANTVREALPGVRISYISVKPSPSREVLLPRIRSTNAMIAAYIHTMTNADYIDTFTPMIGEDGRPRAELFLGDRLHMNEAGYRLWQSVIGAHVAAPDVLAVPAAALRPNP